MKSEIQTVQRKNYLTTLQKVIFGSGDWSYASFGTLRQIFYAIFLTDVVGLEPRLASFAVVLGIIWDAVNDPLVGLLSDRIRTRWGRRRPFLLFFSIPFGLGFVLLWWVPPIHNQIGLAVVVSLMYMLSDTMQTFVSVPIYALTPEITPDYDERTSLTGFRMFFNLVASLVAAVAAPEIVNSVLGGGGTQQQGYMLVASIFGGLAVIPLLLIFFTIRENPENIKGAEKKDPMPLREIIRTAWSNIPFRFATGLFMLNWITFDLVALCLPFYLTYWISQGNLLQKTLGMAIGSSVFGILLITSILVLPFWIWLSGKLSKNITYIIAMSFWAVVQLLIFSVQPGNMTLVLFLSALAGISVSAAHVLPDSIFPDVIEWDELRTGRRQEGIYYGIKNFIRKLTGAIAIFIALQVLGWFGYETPPVGATYFVQPDSALMAIRVLIGPFGSLLLISAILTAWFYPLSRVRHTRIRNLLARKKSRSIDD